MTHDAQRPADALSVEISADVTPTAPAENGSKPHPPDSARQADLAALLIQLAAVVGPTHVLSGTVLAARATHFWDPSPLVAAALVRPADTAQVAAILKLCNAAGRAVVAHGGVTGLVEGDRSTTQDIILSL